MCYKFDAFFLGLNMHFKKMRDTNIIMQFRNVVLSGKEKTGFFQFDRDTETENRSHPKGGRAVLDSSS